MIDLLFAPVLFAPVESPDMTAHSTYQFVFATGQPKNYGHQQDRAYQTMCQFPLPSTKESDTNQSFQGRPRVAAMTLTGPLLPATILVKIFWNFTIFQYRSNPPLVKGNLISSIANLVLKNLTLSILGKQEILEISQIYMDTQPIVSSPFRNLDFENSSLKTLKNRYQTFLSLFNFTGLLHSVPNILSGIVWNFLSLLGPVLFQLQFFDIFYNSITFLGTSIKI